jgi:hypothetical protein
MDLDEPVFGEGPLEPGAGTCVLMGLAAWTDAA